MSRQEKLRDLSEAVKFLDSLIATTRCEDCHQFCCLVHMAVHHDCKIGNVPVSPWAERFIASTSQHVVRNAQEIVEMVLGSLCLGAEPTPPALRTPASTAEGFTAILFGHETFSAHQIPASCMDDALNKEKSASSPPYVGLFREVRFLNADLFDGSEYHIDDGDAILIRGSPVFPKICYKLTGIADH